MNSNHNDLEKIEDGLSKKSIYRKTEKNNTKIIIDFSKDKREFKNFLNVYEILLKVTNYFLKITNFQELNMKNF